MRLPATTLPGVRFHAGRSLQKRALWRYLAFFFSSRRLERRGEVQILVLEVPASDGRGSYGGGGNARFAFGTGSFCDVQSVGGVARPRAWLSRRLPRTSASSGFVLRCVHHLSPPLSDFQRATCSARHVCTGRCVPTDCVTCAAAVESLSRAMEGWTLRRGC